LFGQTASPDFDRERVQQRAAALAARGVYVGTSSWKYEGWLGQLYARDRYEFRGRLSKARFEKHCLTEYAEVFKTVCVDAAYYDFPKADGLLSLAAQTPDDFRFGFKVTDAITVKTFPTLDRFSERAGRLNADYLNATLFADSFLEPCEKIRPKVGVLMFEFSRFTPSDYPDLAHFILDLDKFFSRLPQGWPYAVEMRNRKWLQPDYFACLARHGIAHVFNSWQDMPSVTEQMAAPGSRPNPELVAARFLLKPGRKYDAAVNAFQPYSKTVEINEPERQAGAALMLEGMQRQRPAKTMIYVNNRLEGNALATIAAMIEILDRASP
jgi:uncharacterized protein YecE (DUF72 family)